MKKVISRRLVVDASVMRSAGKTEHPISKACRDTLYEILIICHKVVITAEILEEWKKHRSTYSATWLSSMVARKKIIKIGAVENQELRAGLSYVALSHNEIEAVYKDIHLIDAAIEMDKIIISCDHALKTILDKAVLEVTTIREILYVNPVRNAIETVTWLQEGATTDKKWCVFFQIGPREE